MHTFAPNSLFASFSQVPDPRSRHGRRFALTAMPAVACAAILCGCRSFAAIAQWTRLQPLEWLHRLGFHSHPPRKGAFEYLFRRLDLAAFEQALSQWVATVLVTDSESLRSTPLDGKTLRGSHSRLRPAVHLLALLDRPTGGVLQPLAVDAKTNEHKAALQLLEGLLLKGRIVTADAMFCHRDVAQKILDGGGHYFLEVKDNQETLRRDIATAFEPAFSPS